MKLPYFYKQQNCQRAWQPIKQWKLGNSKWVDNFIVDSNKVKKLTKVLQKPILKEVEGQREVDKAIQDCLFIVSDYSV